MISEYSYPCLDLVPLRLAADDLLSHDFLHQRPSLCDLTHLALVVHVLVLHAVAALQAPARRSADVFVDEVKPRLPVEHHFLKPAPILVGLGLLLFVINDEGSSAMGGRDLRNRLCLLGFMEI